MVHGVRIQCLELWHCFVTALSLNLAIAYCIVTILHGLPAGSDKTPAGCRPSFPSLPQVWSASKEQLQRQLGSKTGLSLWQYAHGQDDRQVG
jgi:hypothetical protein